MGIRTTDLARYWHIAARVEPPVWADAAACMPDLSCVRADLPFDEGYQSISAVAQLLLLTIASYPEYDGVVADWGALGRCINVHAPVALKGIEELAAAAWLTRFRLYPAEQVPSVMQLAKQSVLIRVDPE